MDIDVDVVNVTHDRMDWGCFGSKRILGICACGGRRGLLLLMVIVDSVLVDYRSDCTRGIRSMVSVADGPGGWLIDWFEVHDSRYDRVLMIPRPARSWIDTYYTVCMYVDCLLDARARAATLQWCYTALHGVTRRYMSLHVVTCRYMSLHGVTRRYMTLHNFKWRYTTLNDVTLQSSLQFARTNMADIRRIRPALRDHRLSSHTSKKSIDLKSVVSIPI